MPQSGGAPELTLATVKLVIAKLGKKLEPFQKSSATEQEKDQFREDVLALMMDLSQRVRTAGSAGIDVAVWVQMHKDTFKSLTERYVQALGLQSGDKGACFYTPVGSTKELCFMTTSDG